MRIDAYRNLNKAKGCPGLFVWSLRIDGKVDGHHAWLYLDSVDLRVQSGGLERIRAANCRNVYAYLRAAEYCLPSDLDSASQDPTLEQLAADGYRALTLNPFKEGVFVWADDRSPAPLHLDAVWLTPFGAFGLE